MQNYLDMFFSDPEGSILSYLGRVKRGYDMIIRTPFYDGKDQETVLSNWRKTLGTIQHEWPTLYQFEEDLAKKVGPMSVMEPLANRLEDVDSYYTSISRGGKPILAEALERCFKEWGNDYCQSLKLRSVGDTVSRMKLSTNSGSPFFTKRRSVVFDTIPCETWIQDEEVYSRLGHSHLITRVAAIIGWRGQEGGPEPEDVKQRVVWMFPFSVNINELQFYQPATEWFQNHNLVPAWNGLEAVDTAVTKLFDTKNEDDLIVCTDFTKFDQHFNSYMQNAARALISGMLKSGKSERDWVKDVFPVKYMIPIVLQPNLFKVGKHGMASGSGGTNFDETLSHRALQHEVAYLHGQDLNPYSMCLGDDGIISYPGITIKDVVDSYSVHGLEMNTSKQYASTDDCVYLRRWHHTKYRKEGISVGVYSTFRALGRMMYQERFLKNWGEKAVALRQLAILENCKHHPLREEFAQYCMKGDKFRLGIDIPGFLVNIEREASKIKDDIPDLLGYTQSLGGQDTSISNWWIVKYLKSIS